MPIFFWYSSLLQFLLHLLCHICLCWPLYRAVHCVHMVDLAMVGLLEWDLLVEYRKWVLELPCVEGLKPECLRVVLLSAHLHHYLSLLLH